MKIHSSVRLAALPLALCTVFPAWAQNQLKETVVTATRFSDSSDSLPMGVSVITAEQIRASGVTTVNEAVMRVLGVVGRQDLWGGGEYALDLRGFGETAASNQVLIVDGIRLNEADISTTRLAGIPIESVERIEVLRGSGAVLYGEGATGGVIIITTKAGMGKERTNAASVYAGAGSFGLREARANATLASGGFSLDLATMKRDSDNYRDNFRSSTEGNSLVGQWSNDWLRLGARYSEDRLDSGLPGGLTAAQYASNPRQAKSDTDHAHIENVRQGVFAEAQVGDWQLAADAGWRTKHLTSVWSKYPYAYDVDAKQYALRARHETVSEGLKNQLMLGTDNGSWTRSTAGEPPSIADQSSHALYLKDDLTLAGSGTRLSAGWRTERIAKAQDDLAISGRQQAWELGVSQPFGQNLTGYGRVGRSFRLASVDEFNFTSPGVGLKPQTSRDIEVGSRWNYQVAGKAGKFEARLYRSLLDDEIGYDPNAVGPFGPGANVNFDPTRREGIEFEASQELNSALALRATAGLRKSSFRSGPYAGNDVPLAPKQTVSVRADWIPMAGHRVVGGVNWVASQHPDFENACHMPSYVTADIRYAHQWQRAELSLGVTNLFDHKYYTQAYGCAAGVTTSIYPEAGRAFTASVRVSF